MRSIILFLAALALVSCGQSERINVNSARLGEAWNRENDPIKMEEGYVSDFAALPLSASLEKTPWSDSYWPSVQGGISARWQGGGPLFQPRLFALRMMPLERLARMSPAEKYDVYIGNYNYDTKRQERTRTRPSVESWEGICHGWAPASMLFEEPKPVTLRGANGITVPFGSSDVKALLSFYQGQVSDAPTKFLGERCNSDLERDPAAGESSSCRDTNAGAFHVVLTNMLGLKKKGFVIDRTRSSQVWNQPVWKYESRVEETTSPSPGAALGTVQEVVVSSAVTYTVEIQPQWNALGAKAPSATAQYRYRLELDGNGKIIGGEWLTSDRPDFMWMQEAPEFEGYFASLKEIYQASIRQN